MWLTWSLVTPRLAVASASAAAPSPGKLETDYQLLADLRKLGDGHNAADPAFETLKANLLAEYDVDTVDELPINFRGAVAQASEADLTQVMNEDAERRMEPEARQSRHGHGFGWLSPVLAEMETIEDQITVVGDRQAYRGNFEDIEIPAADQSIDEELLVEVGALNLNDALDLSAAVARQNNFGGFGTPSPFAASQATSTCPAVSSSTASTQDVALVDHVISSASSP